MSSMQIVISTDVNGVKFTERSELETTSALVASRQTIQSGLGTIVARPNDSGISIQTDDYLAIVAGDRVDLYTETQLFANVEVLTYIGGLLSLSGGYGFGNVFPAVNSRIRVAPQTKLFTNVAADTLQALALNVVNTRAIMCLKLLSNSEMVYYRFNGKKTALFMIDPTASPGINQLLSTGEGFETIAISTDSLFPVEVSAAAMQNAEVPAEVYVPPVAGTIMTAGNGTSPSDPFDCILLVDITVLGPVDGFEIQYKSDDGAWVDWSGNPTNGASTVYITGLPKNVLVSLRVRAIADGYSPGPWSDTGIQRFIIATPVLTAGGSQPAPGYAHFTVTNAADFKPNVSSLGVALFDSSDNLIFSYAISAVGTSWNDILELYIGPSASFFDHYVVFYPNENGMNPSPKSNNITGTGEPYSPPTVNSFGSNNATCVLDWSPGSFTQFGLEFSTDGGSTFGDYVSGISGSPYSFYGTIGRSGYAARVKGTSPVESDWATSGVIALPHAAPQYVSGIGTSNGSGDTYYTFSVQGPTSDGYGSGFTLEYDASFTSDFSVIVESGVLYSSDSPNKTFQRPDTEGNHLYVRFRTVAPTAGGADGYGNYSDYVQADLQYTP